MPLSGGAADKFGNRFEGRWTVLGLADVLDERADAIRLEPPGEEGSGVEFWLCRAAAYEFHARAPAWFAHRPATASTPFVL